jgi:pyruvate-formate lyase-activating enzyme
MNRSSPGTALEGVGMKAGRFFRLLPSDLIRLPSGSEIFKLPQRAAVSYDPSSLRFVEDRSSLAVAAFLPPGYTVTYNSAYKEIGRAKKLPLFAYAACTCYKGDVYAAAVRVDKSLCHDSTLMDTAMVREGALRLKALFPKNRLVSHLKRCALEYGCPNAKNFFSSRYEAPLPTSPACNASCAGCISFQKAASCPAAQPRIEFVPTPEEIAEIVLFHIRNVASPIVSFGQGCEGEPLLCADTIGKAIRLIRLRTKKGTINMNTNGSSPKDLARLFDAGLDSVRISLNSAREKYYNAYYKPRGYTFADVARSADIARKKGGFVSLNYLTMPGFTDSKEEFKVFGRFLRTHRVDMIQWRNLNYDPVAYFKELKLSVDAADMLGVKEIMVSLKKEFPRIKMGYFNKNG